MIAPRGEIQHGLPYKRMVILLCKPKPTDMFAVVFDFHFDEPCTCLNIHC